MSLFWRIFAMNAAVLITAAVLLLSPWVTVSSPVHIGEAIVVIVGVVAMLVTNALLFRFGLAPLRRLSRAMAAADLVRPGARPKAVGRGEMADLVQTFNAMLDRLERERSASSARVASAQEAERRHLARDLHDEVGQTLTAVLLQLKWLADRAPADLRDDLSAVQETTRDGLDEIRRIARRLRPGVLEDLGLASALRALAAEFDTPGVTVRHHIDPALPKLAHEAELAIYRVAQEGLANAARHSHATRIGLELRGSGPDSMNLVVWDNGHGYRGAEEGSGIHGMRERALLIGARFFMETTPEGGTEVRLQVPVGEGPER